MTAEPERRGYNSSRERVQFTTGNIQNKFNDEGGSFRRNSLSSLKDYRTASKPEQRSNRNEENRLLGSQSSGPDPNGFPIPVPGKNTQRRTSILKKGSFRPIDTLDCGPGHLQIPKTSPTNVTRKRESIHAERTVAPTSLGGEDDDGTPRKRQKTEKPASIIDIEDDSLILEDSSTKRAGSPPEVLIRQSQYIKEKAADYDARPIIGPDELDEQFTRSARDERIESTKMESSHARQPYRDGKSIQMSAVEIPLRRSGSPPSSYMKGQKRDTSHARTDRQPRSYNRESTESPDELQGDKTVSESWKYESRHGRRLSPSNIRHSTFASPGKRQKKKSKEEAFDCTMFRCGSLCIDEPYTLSVDKESFNFSIKQGGNFRKLEQHNFKKATAISYSADNKKTKVRFHYPMSKSQEDAIDIVVDEGSGRTNFRQFLEHGVPNIRKRKKSSDWMDKVFDNGPKSSDVHPSGGQDDSPVSKEAPANQLVESSRSTQPTRRKLSEKMLDKDGTNSKIAISLDRGSRTLNSKSKQSANAKRTISEFLSHSIPHAGSSEDEAIIPVKTYQNSDHKARETRSTAKSRNILIESDGEVDPPLSPVKIRNGIWSKPLVYPKTGRKKAEISVHDLERLRDNEFLNDNIIGFYMRFLEHHLERQHTEVSKRVYFFNSYFYATLTNSPRGGKGINYQGVEKWTRAVNIFNYDYVVVPINENAHWYVAIICNLPHLLRPGTEEASDPEANDAAESEKKDGLAINTTPNDVVGDSVKGAVVSGNGKESKLQESFTSMTLLDTAPRSPSHPDQTGAAIHAEEKADVDNDEWPDGDENPQDRGKNGEKAFPVTSKNAAEDTQSKPQQATEETQSKPIKKRGKKSRRSGPKYDTRQPIIITFDSLSCARSPTHRILREYLEEEAKSKQSLSIDTKLIKAMNAQQIPRQSNFSDCGLYLLAYIEKFVQDPDNFIYKLLRKEMDENEDWPEMKPGIFRRRLRDFLFRLYNEQITQAEGEHPDQQLLVDANPLNILLVEGSKNRDKGEGKDITADQNVTTPNKPPPGSAQSSERRRKANPDSPTRNTTPIRSSPRLSRKTDSTGQPSPSLLINGSPMRKTTRQSPPIHSSPQLDEEPFVPRHSSPSIILGDSPVHSPVRRPPMLDGIAEYLAGAANEPSSPRARVEVPGTPPLAEEQLLDTIVISSPSQSQGQKGRWDR